MANEKKVEPLVWWLSCDEQETIGSPRPGWPDYLRSEYLSREGRAGRGRLWVAPRFGEVSADWDAGPVDVRLAAESRGGIVVDRETARVLASLPGFIADLSMRRWTPTQPMAKPDEDWTVGPDGRSNTSPRFKTLVSEVERIIRDSGFDLINGRAGTVAGLIMAQLVHEHGLAPRAPTSGSAKESA